MAPLITTRRATLGDVDVLLANVQAGFDSYVAFAPEAWHSRNVARDRERTADLLASAGTWGLIALAGRRAVGHIAFVPAREHAAGEERRNRLKRPFVPGLAHLWQLFVLPEWWGRGVAALLHDAVTAEMRAQDYGRARLFTPSRHARARRFYERRGWTATGEEWSEDLALMLTEYRLTLRRRESTQ